MLSRGNTAGAAIGSAWGSSAMKRGGAKASGSGATGFANPSSGPVGDRGWAAVASGSGRNSPLTATERMWDQPTMVTQLNGARVTTAPTAGIIPNPNDPRRSATHVDLPAATGERAAEPAAADGPVPESWEDDN